MPPTTEKMWTEFSFTAGRMRNGIATWEESLAAFYKSKLTFLKGYNKHSPWYSQRNLKNKNFCF